ncbi:hypothetical protein [Paraburkholderia sacchari]
MTTDVVSIVSTATVFEAAELMRSITSAGCRSSTKRERSSVS